MRLIVDVQKLQGLAPPDFCIKNNEFGVKGVSGGLDLYHFLQEGGMGVEMRVLVCTMV
jgi:hypothetical protein